MPFSIINSKNGIISLYVTYIPNYNESIKVVASTDQEHAFSVLKPVGHSWGGTGEGEQFIQF